jgi:hypothetical protein
MMHRNTNRRSGTLARSASKGDVTLRSHSSLRMLAEDDAHPATRIVPRQVPQGAVFYQIHFTLTAPLLALRASVERND